MVGKSMKIQLDRPSAIYYAGEVVTGTLTLHTPENSSINCRSLSVKLIGESKSKWHTGSGDDRRDYEGEKKFQYGQLTVEGNYYETDVIDEAGSDVTFGQANGDGTLYIPCGNGPGDGRMRVIVRIRDYDFGKRDDDLGEILLDATELAEHGEAKTYELTRKGKPEKGTVTLAGRFVPSDSIAPPRIGQTGSPSPSSHQYLILTVLGAKGLRQGDWFGKNDVYVQAYRAPDGIAIENRNQSLPKPQKNTTLPGGTTEYRFAFPLRNDAPPSAEFRVSDYAYIRYCIVSKIDTSGWKDTKSKLYFTVIPNRPGPKPCLLHPFQSQCEGTAHHRCCCMDCKEIGTMSVKLDIPRLAFAVGETLDLSNCEVLNNSPREAKIEIYLKQYIKLQTTSRTYGTSYKQKEFYTYLFRKNLPAETSLSQKFANELTQYQIPVVPPSFFGAAGSPEAKREALMWSYTLVLTAKIQGGTEMKRSVPVLICAAPPFQSSIEDARVNETLPANMDIWSLSNFVVKDVKPCPTMPILTGAEDGGHFVPQAGYENGANLQVGQQKMDQNASIEPYKPMILTFDTISTSTVVSGAPMSQEMDRFDNKPSDENPSPLPSDPNTNTKTVDISALIENLGMAYDPREVVGKWIKENPSSAASLSPQDTADILSKVTFSLNQAPVAREISSGMGGNLTCNHIMAALGACPYSKLEVAKAMAPDVKDPENKEQILNSVYSFERTDLEKHFSA